MQCTQTQLDLIYSLGPRGWSHYIIIIIIITITTIRISEHAHYISVVNVRKQISILIHSFAWDGVATLQQLPCCKKKKIQTENLLGQKFIS